MNLLAAHNQWATRPADERFWTLGDMYAACRSYRDAAKTSTVKYSSLRATISDGEPAIMGSTGQVARFSNFAFKQLCSKIGAPASYLETLPVETTTALMEYGLRKRSEDGDDTAAILMHSNGGLLTRAFLSEDYKRIWNFEVVSRLQNFAERGWKVPPARPAFSNQPGTRPATEADVLQVRSSGLSIQVGQPIAPAGLYASNHDMFAFLVNEENRIADGSDSGLSRGFFVRNSEVGDSSLRVTLFYYRTVCGNHIVWNAKDVKEIRIRHVGTAQADGLLKIAGDLREFCNSSASDTEARILRARTFELGATKEKVIETIFGKVRDGALTQRVLGAAYNEAEKTEDNPRSVWGMVQGLTRVSQGDYADQRTRIDEAAGKVLQMAF